MIPASLPLRAVFILLSCNIVWALNVVVSKLAVDELGVPPLFYTALRSLLVVLVLLPLLRTVPRQLGAVLAIGFTITGGSFALQFLALQTASPSAVGIVNLSGAPMTVLFAVLFLGEEVGWRRALGMVLALGGVGLAIGSPAGMESGWGLMFAFAGAVLGALGSVFVKRIEIDAIALQAWAGLASLAAMLPASLVFETGQMAAFAAAPLVVGACAVFAGLVVSVGAHTAYFRLLQAHDANLIVPLTLLTPLLTILFGTLLTGDTVGWPLLAGGALAIGGVGIIVVRPSRTIFKPLLVRARF